MRNRTSISRLKLAVMLTNNYIADTHAKTSMFATVFFGIQDLRSGLLTYINAGHFPPVVLRAQGDCELLRLTGPAVGAMPDMNHTTGEVRLEPGDLLFACTDGLIDAASPAGASFDLDDLPDWFSPTRPLSQSLAHIQSAVSALPAGVRQMDDIAMLAVRRTVK